MPKPRGLPAQPRRGFGIKGGKARPAFPGEPDLLFSEEQARTITEPQDRIEFLVDLMASCRYVTRVTITQLQVIWGVSQQRVQQYAEAAAAVMRTVLRRRDVDIRLSVLQTFDVIRVEALNRGRDRDDEYAFKYLEVAYRATEGMARFVDAKFDRSLKRFAAKKGTGEGTPLEEVVGDAKAAAEANADGEQVGQIDPSEGAVSRIASAQSDALTVPVEPDSSSHVP